MYEFVELNLSIRLCIIMQIPMKNIIIHPFFISKIPANNDTLKLVWDTIQVLKVMKKWSFVKRPGINTPIYRANQVAKRICCTLYVHIIWPNITVYRIECLTPVTSVVTCFVFVCFKQTYTRRRKYFQIK